MAPTNEGNVDSDQELQIIILLIFVIFPFFIEYQIYLFKIMDSLAIFNRTNSRKHDAAWSGDPASGSDVRAAGQSRARRTRRDRRSARRAARPGTVPPGREARGAARSARRPSRALRHRAGRYQRRSRGGPTDRALRDGGGADRSALFDDRAQHHALAFAADRGRGAARAAGARGGADARDAAGAGARLPRHGPSGARPEAAVRGAAA